MDFLNALKTTPSLSDGKMLREPYRSVGFLVLYGQRPVSVLLVFRILSESGGPLSGKEIAIKAADILGVDPKLLNVGRYYKDRIGDVLNALCELGLVEKTSEAILRPKATSISRKPKYRMAAPVELRTWLSHFDEKRGIFGLRPSHKTDLVKLFQTRFDDKLGTVTMSEKGENPFNVGELIKSVMMVKSFYGTLHVLTQIEKDLRTGMTTREIQRLVYDALCKSDRNAAERFSQQFQFQEPLSVVFQGKQQRLTADLIKRVVHDETCNYTIIQSFLVTIDEELKDYARKSSVEIDEDRLRHAIRVLIRSRFFVPSDPHAFILGALKEADVCLTNSEEMLRCEMLESTCASLNSAAEQLLPTFFLSIRCLPLKNLKENAEYLKHVLTESSYKTQILEILKEDEPKNKSVIIGPFHSLAKAPYSLENSGRFEKILTHLRFVREVLGRREGQDKKRDFEEHMLDIDYVS